MNPALDALALFDQLAKVLPPHTYTVITGGHCEATWSTPDGIWMVIRETTSNPRRWITRIIGPSSSIAGDLTAADVIALLTGWGALATASVQTQAGHG